MRTTTSTAVESCRSLALHFRLGDSERTIHYLDATTGKLVESYTGRSRWNHRITRGCTPGISLWLYAKRPGWDLAKFPPMLG